MTDKFSVEISYHQYHHTPFYVPREGVIVHYHGAKGLWKTHANIDIIIAEHKQFNCFEIIAYHPMLGIEANRLYADITLLRNKIDYEEIANLIKLRQEDTLRHKHSFDISLYTEKLTFKFLTKYLYRRIEPVNEPDPILGQTFEIYLKKFELDYHQGETEFEKFAFLCDKPVDLIPLETCFLGRVRNTKEIDGFLKELNEEALLHEKETRIAELIASSVDGFRLLLNERKKYQMEMDRKKFVQLRWQRACRKVMRRQLCSKFRVIVDKLFQHVSPSTSPTIGDNISIDSIPSFVDKLPKHHTLTKINNSDDNDSDETSTITSIKSCDPKKKHHQSSQKDFHLPHINNNNYHEPLRLQTYVSPSSSRPTSSQIPKEHSPSSLDGNYSHEFQKKEHRPSLGTSDFHSIQPINRGTIEQRPSSANVQLKPIKKRLHCKHKKDLSKEEEDLKIMELASRMIQSTNELLDSLLHLGKTTLPGTTSTPSPSNKQPINVINPLNQLDDMHNKNILLPTMISDTEKYNNIHTNISFTDN